MPREHKEDPSDATYICDTDGYRLQRGCYYHVRLPGGDGRKMSIVAPQDKRYNYFGPLCFGPEHAALFSLHENNEFWASDQKARLNVQRARGAEEHGISASVDAIYWHYKRLGETLNGHRTSSGETIIWGDFMGGTLHLSETPIVDTLFDENYYPAVFTLSWDKEANARMGNFAVEFVYVGDM
ncbi:hypothetical protein BO86DRAFT_407558 [Aspergillus japonicus CBS 114.51]|uniref:Uncharacterized protein n=1 Tax=Aspergillus japonicus CBS 114.51 TaxID=1448312 RepID=A0A8T8X969_ASPJA|nr:hypothetical protein BO86DRAFT_407558 [Aspergillus japonicus CBS 114.51]RAH84565.1 hypothetical protein BO86DRAFT_407558 [Aspergillus japonicus CBS 114.51]